MNNRDTKAEAYAALEDDFGDFIPKDYNHVTSTFDWRYVNTPPPGLSTEVYLKSLDERTKTILDMIGGRCNTCAKLRE